VLVRKLTILVLGLALVAAGCGDDDGLTEGEQAIVEAIVDSAMADPDPDNPLSTDREAAACFAEGLVGDMGVTRLAEIGLTAGSADSQAAFAAMTDEELDEMADLALGCIDVEALITEQMVAEGLGAESAACFADQLGDSEFFRQAFIAGMAGQEVDLSTDPAVAAEMLEAATECLSPDELGSLFGG
jgi:hypothetical protein